MYRSLQDIAQLAKPDARFEPRPYAARAAEISGWRAALARVRSNTG
jgi:hypothetical protein